MLGLGIDHVEFLYRGKNMLGAFNLYRIAKDPLTELQKTIVFAFPFQALTVLVALVGSRGGVSLRLGDFHYVDHHRHTVVPCKIFGLGVGIQKRRVVPGFHLDDLAALILSWFSLETRKHLRDVFLGSLVVGRNRNPVAVVPDGNHHRNLKSAGSV